MSKKHNKNNKNKKVKPIKDKSKIKARDKVEKIWNLVMEIFVPVAIITFILSAFILIVLVGFSLEVTTQKAFFIEIAQNTCFSMLIIIPIFSILILIIDSSIENKGEFNPLLIIVIIITFTITYVSFKMNMDLYQDIPQAISQQYSTYVGVIEDTEYSSVGTRNGVKVLRFKVNDLEFSSTNKHIVNAIKYKGKYKIYYLQNTKYVIDVEYLGNE